MSLGGTLDLNVVKAMYIKADATNTLNILVGGAAVGAFESWLGAAGDKIVIPPGGTFLLTTPDAIGFDSASNNKLKIAASAAGSVTYDIVLIGEGTVT